MSRGRSMTAEPLVGVSGWQPDSYYVKLQLHMNYQPNLLQFYSCTCSSTRNVN